MYEKKTLNIYEAQIDLKKSTKIMPDYKKTYIYKNL